MKESLILLLAGLVAGVAALVAAPPVSAQDEDLFVRVTTDTELRTAAGGGTLVGISKTGDVFRLGEKKGEWTAVFAFSGEYRYLRTQHVAPTSRPAPPPEAGLQAIYGEIKRVERTAMEEAEEKYPTDFEAQIDWERLRVDQLLLPLFQRHGVAPALKGSIAYQGAINRW